MVYTMGVLGSGSRSLALGTRRQGRLSTMVVQKPATKTEEEEEEFSDVSNEQIVEQLHMNSLDICKASHQSEFSDVLQDVIYE